MNDTVVYSNIPSDAPVIIVGLFCGFLQYSGDATWIHFIPRTVLSPDDVYDAASNINRTSYITISRTGNSFHFIGHIGARAGGACQINILYGES